MAKAHDSKCFELACHFLSGNECRTDEDHDELAQVIQDAIESWLNDRENSAEAAYHDHQQSLMEGGGSDDSAYRRDMTEAGRSHLLGGR